MTALGRITPNPVSTFRHRLSELCRLQNSAAPRGAADDDTKERRPALFALVVEMEILQGLSNLVILQGIL